MAYSGTYPYKRANVYKTLSPPFLPPTINRIIKRSTHIDNKKYILITVCGHEIIIKERCLGWIGLFLLDNTNTIPFTKISQHLAKPVKRYLYEILVVVLSKIDICFQNLLAPKIIFP